MSSPIRQKSPCSFYDEKECDNLEECYWNSKLSTCIPKVSLPPELNQVIHNYMFSPLEPSTKIQDIVAEPFRPAAARFLMNNYSSRMIIAVVLRSGNIDWIENLISLGIVSVNEVAKAAAHMRPPREDIILWMLELGANIYHYLLIEITSQYGPLNMNLVHAILERHQPSQQTADTLLENATRYGHLELFYLALKLGATDYWHAMYELVINQNEPQWYNNDYNTMYEILVSLGAPAITNEDEEW